MFARITCLGGAYFPVYEVRIFKDNADGGQASQIAFKRLGVYFAVYFARGFFAEPC